MLVRRARRPHAEDALELVRAAGLMRQQRQSRSATWTKASVVSTMVASTVALGRALGDLPLQSSRERASTSRASTMSWMSVQVPNQRVIRPRRRAPACARPSTHRYWPDLCRSRYSMSVRLAGLEAALPARPRLAAGPRDGTSRSTPRRRSSPPARPCTRTSGGCSSRGSRRAASTRSSDRRSSAMAWNRSSLSRSAVSASRRSSMSMTEPT